MYIPSQIMAVTVRNRRLFVGDMHGCLAELNDLLEKFVFRQGLDVLFSVGDIVGKGPNVLGTLHRLQELKAVVVCGNHDQFLLKAAQTPEAERTSKDIEYLDSLQSEAAAWIPYIASWPAYVELSDIIMVHGGLEPGKLKLADMSERILIKIRTWDGKGDVLHSRNDPPWYECVKTNKTVVFGHWAERGLIDLPSFKGLDTGCVYGGKLTGWCPEENRFLQVPARQAYTAIHRH